MSTELLNRPRPADFHAPDTIDQAAKAVDAVKAAGQDYTLQTARIDSIVPIGQLESEKVHGHDANLSVDKHFKTGEIHLVEAETTQKSAGNIRTATASMDNTGTPERDYVTIRRGGKERLYEGDKARRLAPFVINAAVKSVQQGSPQPRF